MTGFRAAAKQRERMRDAAAQTMRRGGIVSVERQGMLDAVAVRYVASETRYLTRKQAEREPEVWAACTWWH